MSDELYDFATQKSAIAGCFARDIEGFKNIEKTILEEEDEL